MRARSTPALAHWLLLSLALCTACRARDRHAPAPPAPPRRALAAPPPPADPRPAFDNVTTMLAPPYPTPPGVAQIVAHAPPGFDPRGPLHLVIFFHGSGQCAAHLAASGEVVCRPGMRPWIGAGFSNRHDDAATMSLFALPQFAFLGGGSSGRMHERGYFRQFVEELVSREFAPALGGPRHADDVASITLVAHSAGHMPVLAILEAGDLADKVQNVVLFDAFFRGGVETYARWLAGSRPEAPRHFVSVYNAWASQLHNHAALAERVRHSLGESALAFDPPGALADAIRTHPVVMARRSLDHGWMPLLFFTKTLAALPLPPRPLFPPRAPAGPMPPARPLAVGQSVAGELVHGDGVLQNGCLADEYVLHLAAGQRVAVTVAGGPSVTEPGSRLDVFAQVLVANTELASDDDGGGLFDSRVEFEAPREGDYTVRVTTAGSGEKRGGYTVRADAAEAAGAAEADAGG